MITLTGIRIVAFFSILLCTLIFGILPLPLFNKLSETKRERFMGCANAFAAGIFLSTGFLHLLGETQETLTHEFEDSDIPIALLCASIGFLFTFFFEKVFFADFHSHSTEGEIAPLLEDKYGAVSEETPQDRPKSLAKRNTSSSDVLDEKKGHYHHHLENPFLPYMILLILSFHSIISGIALGFQSEAEGVIPLFIAIMSHKWVESIAVAVSILRMKVTRRKFLLLLSIYAFTEPLGVALGSIIVETTDGLGNQTVAEAIAGAIASGTFIYVATVDIMVEEFAKGGRFDRYAKMLFCAVGYGLMAGLIFIVPHSHESDNAHSHK